MINHYVSAIVPSLPSSAINVPTLIGLSVAIGLLRPLTVTDGSRSEVYYAPVDINRIGRPFHHSRLLYLEARRAEHQARPWHRGLTGVPKYTDHGWAGLLDPKAQEKISYRRGKLEAENLTLPTIELADL